MIELSPIMVFIGIIIWMSSILAGYVIGKHQGRAEGKNNLLQYIINEIEITQENIEEDDYFGDMDV